MLRPIKSRSIDLIFCTQVRFDITDLLQLSESESDTDIKNSTPGQTFQNFNFRHFEMILFENVFGRMFLKIVWKCFKEIVLLKKIVLKYNFEK